MSGVQRRFVLPRGRPDARPARIRGTINERQRRSDIDGFVEAAGTICLVESDRRIQFEFNLSSAKQAGLHISSRLLRLARTVRETPL